MSAQEAFHKLKWWYVVAVFPALIGGAMLLSMLKDCRQLPDAKTQHKVYTARTFSDSIGTAMDLINRAAECVILVEGTLDDYDIQFIGMTDTPCAVDSLHRGIESGHTANAYRCPKTGKWDIDVEKPGDIRLMVCIAMHELMHTLGFKDAKDGLMNPRHSCEGRIWPNDAETAQLKKLCDK